MLLSHLHLPRKPSLLTTLAPSFLHRPHQPFPKPSPTAWLDGLRGLAAFLVYIRHFAAASHPDIQYGYGTEGQHYNIISLPFLHLITAGPAMVALFFIISGYALSLGPVGCMQRGDGEGALVRLSSGVFRRGFRLFVPGVVSTFLIMGFVAAGWYEKVRAYENEVDMPGFHEPQPPMVYGESLGTQLAIWAGWTWRWLDVWTPQNHAYDVHLWTLPVEFRSSMILFMALVGFARTRPRVRLGMLGACVVYCHYTNAWEGWLFFAGSFLAQLKMLQEEAESAPPSLALADASDEKLLGTAESQTSSMDHARILLFVAGLYLLSSPDLMLFPSEDSENPDAPPGPVPCAPGYCLLSTLSPQSWPEPFRFLHCLGAFLVVYATSSTRTSTLRSLFDNPLSVYLGKISFALYLVHGPVVHMLGFWLVPLCWRWSGKDTLMQKEVGFGIAFLVVTAVVVWVADVFWRGVDQKCVAFARWCEGFVLVRER